MGQILLGVFLIVFAISTFATVIPMYVCGILAGVAGILLLVGK